MTGPLGTADFFALEAGECLDRLETLAARPDGVPADEFLRVARALRGSALMAGRQPIARAAAALELLARSVRDQRRPWDAAAREQSLNAVEDLRLLVRRGAEWTDADTAHAARLAQALESLAGRRVQEGPPRAAAPAAAGELTPGVRAFVARECTLVASALDRAARGARSDPSQREPLYEVLRRMQSLRGLAELSELSPLPELLDGLELALGDLTRLFAPPPEAPVVLEAGARALARVSREVAEQGRPTPDADDAREFTDLLLRAFAAESDVVPIESLFAAGDAEPIRHGALTPAFEAPGPLGAIELLSHGEHLYQIADQIERARSRTERDLKLYALVSPLRSLATGGESPVQPGLRAFADAARSHIAGGTATDRPGVFADVLREAGALLRAAGGRGDPGDPVSRLRSLAERLTADAALTPAVAAVEMADDDPASDATVAVEDNGAVHADEIVPIQALAYTGEQMIVEWGTAGAEGAEADRAAGTNGAEADKAAGPEAAGTDETVVPIESLAPAEHDASGLFESSWASYERLVASADAATAEPAPSIAAQREPPSPGRSPAELPLVDISDLLYRGRGALERADVVRAELADALRADTPLAELRPLVDELLDLIPLALE
jgi:chemotaxis protein histidine kinase CheA